MENTSQSRRISLTEVSDALEKTVTQLDQSRAADLDEMSQVRAAKYSVLARDRERLAAKLGVSDPRVVALDRSLRLHAESGAGFRSEIAASSTPAPRVTAQGWALHGNVFDARRQPVPNITAALYQGDTWVQSLGYACTDQNGYFLLSVADAVKPDASSVTLRLLSTGKIIFTDPRPVALSAGHVEYREIVLGDAAVDCSPPAGSGDANTPPGKKHPGGVNPKSSSKK